jgi:hypothetical protein
MRKCFLILALFCSFPPLSLRAGDMFRIQRVKVMTNPFPDEIEGGEVYEVKFKVLPPGWIKGTGWCIKTFDREKNPAATLTTAYFPESENPVHRMTNRGFKGESAFTAYFSRPPDCAFAVVVVGNQSQFEVTLFPSTETIEEFELSQKDILSELIRSSYEIIGRD